MAWISKGDVERWFTHQAPDFDQVACIQAIRRQAKVLAELIIEVTPRCADQSAAIRLVREAVMTANAAIVCAKKAEDAPTNTHSQAEASA
jgi:hypothetical protein